MIKKLIFATGAIALAALTYLGGAGAMAAEEKAVKLPAPTVEMPASLQSSSSGYATAIFAGGCFWGVQGVFQHTQGVINAVSGYAGGDKSSATYDSIGSGRTGHAESVQITYDPKVVSYGKLLQIYFSVAHDPTTQYRSAIFYQDAAEKKVAESYIAQLDAAKVFPEKIVTQLTPLAAPLAFYPAETYHQDYATLHPNQPYIATYDLPKIANLKTMMPELYREKPVLVSQAGLAKK